MSHSPFTTPAIQAGPTKLFVGSIPMGITKDQLKEKFSELGQVAEVFLKNDSADPARMWGFVTYVSPEGAALAVATYNDKMVFPGSSRPLAVSFARSSSGNSPGDSFGAQAPVGGGIGPTKLFVGSIPAGTTKDVIRAEFEKFGLVTDVFLKDDAKEPGRMWGFVTYQDAAAASAAVPALHERLVLPGGTRACAVSFARNSQAQHSQAANALAYSAGAATTKLFLGTLPIGTTEAVLRKEFERFGMVTEVLLRDDKSDPNRMWGFLTYADAQSAAMAVSTLHEKLMLPGSVRPIAVSFARNSAATQPPTGALDLTQTLAGLGGMTGFGATPMVDHGWKVYYNADGIPYYHHAATSRTQWEVPPELAGATTVTTTADAAAQAALVQAALGYNPGVATAIPTQTVATHAVATQAFYPQATTAAAAQPLTMATQPATAVSAQPVQMATQPTAGFAGMDAQALGVGFAPAVGQAPASGEQRYSPY